MDKGLTIDNEWRINNVAKKAEKLADNMPSISFEESWKEENIEKKHNKLEELVSSY